MALTKISTAGVKDDAVTSGKIPADAIGSSEIAANAVGSSELADNAVDTAAIANNAVTTAKIADDAVGHDQIADNSIHHHHIANGTIVADDLADDAVTSAKIADNAVVADRIADTTITTQKLANSAINTDKLNDNAVTSAKIVDEAVTLDKLPHGTASNDGKFLRANNNADPSYEAIPISARNLIINGAMQVAQRGTSVALTGYQTVDRWQFGGNWPGSAITQAQVDVGYNTIPYDKGFRKSFKLINSNQSAASASDNIEITYSFEGQEIATSGWDYVLSSKKITLSFWVKSSVAQTFYGYFRTFNGVDMKYSFPIVCSTTGWEYKTVSIVGESTLLKTSKTHFLIIIAKLWF